MDNKTISIPKISAHRLISQLQQNSAEPFSPLLIIDLRSFLSFQQVRVRSSLNMFIPKCLLKRKNFTMKQLEATLNSEREKEKFRNRKGARVILYDQDCGVIGKDSPLILVAQKLIEENLVRSVHYLEGGFQSILQNFPHLCSKSPSTTPSHTPLSTPSTLVGRLSPKPGSLKRRTSSVDKEPVQILDYLFLGGQEAAASSEILEKLGIRYILNAAHDCPDPLGLGNTKYHYKRLEMLDHGAQNLSKELLRASFQFIDEARENGGKILVHCKAGQSRSASIVICYLIHTLKWTFQQAYAFVQEKRPCVAPNLGFISQMIQFENFELSKPIQAQTTDEFSTPRLPSTAPFRTCDILISDYQPIDCK